jgi:hypothetical protein
LVTGLSRGKEQPGRDEDPSLPSSAVVMKEYSYTSTPPTGRTACTEPQYLYKGALYLFYSLPNNPEKRCSQLLGCSSVKSRT